MAENIENLILEHLRHVRGRIDKLSDDMDTFKLRMQSLDERLTLVERAVVNIHSDLAVVHSRFDRIERRLDLREADV